MRPSKLPRDIFYMAILTCLTTVTWLILDTYRAFSKNEMPQVPQEQLEPLNPEIDASVFTELEKKQEITGELILPEISSGPVATGSGVR